MRWIEIAVANADFELTCLSGTKPPTTWCGELPANSPGPRLALRASEWAVGV